DSQRAAIEAPPGPMLVLAGPGAGKTFCLIARIRYLIEGLGIDPARICAFTFTNKAAGEIASRLERQLGERAEHIKRGTIHSFCAELLRELGSRIELEPGFGIVDEEYQRSVLRRLEGHRPWHRSVLTRFSAHRFRGDELRQNDQELYDRYRRFLEQRNLLDFDMLVLKTAELLRNRDAADEIRSRWDCVLVDEFQDLNRIQYGIIRELARGHRNVFAVGDDEQSIYSWAGADPEVFVLFQEDFGAARAELGENRRCPREVVTLARRLVTINTPIFRDRVHAEGADRESPFPVAAWSFPDEEREIAWVLDDVRRDREQHSLAWDDFALLYRTNEMGSTAEAAFLSAGIPCRLAQGRALAEDPVVGYVIAALRVIAQPADEIHQESFLQVVLPKALFDDVRAQAEESRQDLMDKLTELARALPRDHGDAKKLWRALYALKNLAALGAKHEDLAGLVDDLLSHRVGEYRTVLEEHHDELSDPAEDQDVVRLAGKLSGALATNRPVWLASMGGAEIALKGMLLAIGLSDVRFGGSPPSDAEVITAGAVPELGIALGAFKAAQLIRSAGFSNQFLDFTAIDLETTDKDIDTAEIVEIAAVRVRDGQIIDKLHSMVRPRTPITAGARRAHGISEEDVASAEHFEQVWPRFRDFCGTDVLVAHNGYRFDFPVLRRMTAALGAPQLCTYDTLPLARDLHQGSAKLADIAGRYGIDPGQSHRALDDTQTLAHVFLALGEGKVARARKTALVNLLDQLGIALALADQDTLGAEARLLRRLTPFYSLSQRSDCLELYRGERELSGDDRLPPVEDVIELLGGESRMARIQADKSAEDRYPAAMARLRPLIEQFAGKPLREQITGFLERVILSSRDVELCSGRVNLLTLHSTKGLEFSRIYIVGVEDAQLPGGFGRSPGPSKREIEESRRLLYVGMTRTKDRLVLTRVDARRGLPTGGCRFLDEMELVARDPFGDP
ncbi:MAG TPA: UvrD-helicase domain-containing protein, partial [Gemmatimonadaceae bacterium]|nr:UvrD-helicase domain-containing protein [Gemmatimonadaceae bacterium]